MKPRKPTKKLTRDDVLTIRELAASGRPTWFITRKIGCHKTTVRLVVRGLLHGAVK